MHLLQLLIKIKLLLKMAQLEFDNTVSLKEKIFKKLLSNKQIALKLQSLNNFY